MIVRNINFLLIFIKFLKYRVLKKEIYCFNFEIIKSVGVPKFNESLNHHEAAH